MDLRILTQEMLVVKAHKEEDKHLYDTKWDMRCIMQYLTPFLKAIDKSKKFSLFESKLNDH